MKRKIQVTGIAAIVAGLLVGGCDAGSFMTGTDPVIEGKRVSLRVHANMASSSATDMSLQVTGEGIDTDLVFDIPVDAGIASGSVRAPIGPDRTFTLRAFNAGGVETHSGETITDVAEGSNQPMQVRLKPRKKNAPEISVTVGSIVVAVTPAMTDTRVGESTRLRATVLDSVGDEVDVAVQWATLQPSVATVDTNGKVLSVGAGSALIVATYGSVGGSAMVQVEADSSAAAVHQVSVSPAADSLPVGSTVQLTATLTDSAGNILTGRTITWSTSDTSVTTVNDTGLVKAIAAGQASVDAISEGVTGSAAITVAAAASQPGSITISPASDTLVGIGDTLTLTAQARDANGNLITNPGIQWSSDNPDILTVDSMGKLTAQAIGAALITASAVCCADATGTYNVVATEPGAVSDLQATAVSSSSVRLRWTQVDDGSGLPADYAIRYGSPTLSWGSAYDTEVIVSGTTVGDSATYTFAGLTAGADYQFQAIAFRGTPDVDATFGPLSNVATATTDTSGSGGGGGGGGTALAPGTASASAGDGRVTLSASAPSGGSTPYSYQWHRSTNSGFTPGSGNAVSGLTSLSDTDTGLSNGTTYYYVLVATDNAGANAAYSQVSATPTTPPSGGDSEPTYTGAAGQTLIIQDDMESYTDATSFGETPATGPALIPYPSPNIGTGWGCSGPGDFSFPTGRGGSGQAVRVQRDGLSEGSGGCPASLNTAGSYSVPPGVVTHYVTYWSRSTMASPLNPGGNSPMQIKWFWFAHPFNRAEFHLTYRLGDWAGSMPNLTYWGLFDVSSAYNNQQPFAPTFEDIATTSADWHRFTYAYRPHSGDGSARDGFARMWIDGKLIVDVSQRAVGVVPAGSFGGKPWCTQSDVDALETEASGNHTVHSLRWLSVQTYSSPAWTFDMDDLTWWTEP